MQNAMLIATSEMSIRNVNRKPIRNVNGTIDREYFWRVATYLNEVLDTKENSLNRVDQG